MAESDTRTAAITAGYCSFCGGPAEQGLSGAWWHVETSCGPAYGVLPPGAVPKGRLGWRARWPAKFVPGDLPEELRREREG